MLTGYEPLVPQNILSFFNQTVEKFHVDNPLRLSHFLSQLLHESTNLTRFEENLNYSADGLHGIFSKYFPTVADALAFARHPSAIASRVYANRMGNGNEASHDGWTYRGRGGIMCTGKTNYEEYGKFAGIDCVKNPDLLLTPEYAMDVSGWFWDKHNLNAKADMGADDITVRNITKVINGSYNGIEDRISKFRKVYQLVAGL